MSVPPNSIDRKDKIMKNYICIDGTKIEISCETAENLKKQFVKEEKPELRHGDYGYYHGYKSDPVIFVKKKARNDELIIVNTEGVCDFSLTDYNKKESIILGNIFDDLKQNAEDLKEFEVGYKDKSNDSKVKFVLLKDGIQMKVGHEYFTTALKQFEKLHQKLGQLIASAKRREDKKEASK